MSSIALAHSAVPAFNGLFFATCATVIPVLFLAVAVQGRTFSGLIDAAATLLKAADAAADAAETADGHEHRRPSPRRVMAALAVWLWPRVIAMTAIFAVMLGAIAEYFAVADLLSRDSPPGDAELVLVTVVLLLVVVAAGPLHLAWMADDELDSQQPGNTASPGHPPRARPPRPARQPRSTKNMPKWAKRTAS